MSDNSLGSQFLISHSHSDISEQKTITESAEKFIQSNLDLHTEHPVPTAKPLHLHIDPQQINNGLAQLQKYKEFANAVSRMNKTLSDSQDILQNGFKLAAPNHVDDKDSGNRDAMLKADHDHTVGNQKKFLVDETGESGSWNPAASQATSIVHLKDPVTDLPGPKLGEIAGKDFASNNLGHSQPFSLTESSTNDISRGIHPVGVSATKQADISIDINDRFTRDFLSEIFFGGILTEDKAGVSPMHKDGAGMSVIMENHEPKHWSYFQKLAHEEFVQKVVSLIDQDLLGTPSILAKDKDGNQKSYHFVPLRADGVTMGHKYSQLHFGEDINKKKLGGADSTVHSDFDHSQVKGSENLRFGPMMENLKSPASQYEISWQMEGIRCCH
ncbi:hypothetical protein P3X46_030316 [Hevea brasiliensis]|uniref:Uncharacterized protein n=1 Tax=Hevea brasiliensis TaxID=3981 RepID=A0ABQ9KGZ3_HEVBR|nr:hypothetical protein P3X46_030316 [Hevea brasiliensis]